MMRQVFWLILVKGLPDGTVALSLTLPKRAGFTATGIAPDSFLLHRISLLIPFGNRIGSKVYTHLKYLERTYQLLVKNLLSYLVHY